MSTIQQDLEREDYALTQMRHAIDRLMKLEDADLRTGAREVAADYALILVGLRNR